MSLTLVLLQDMDDVKQQMQDFKKQNRDMENELRRKSSCIHDLKVSNECPMLSPLQCGAKGPAAREQSQGKHRDHGAAARGTRAVGGRAQGASEEIHEDF